MMYEALLFDMNALGDIPDKDFTSRTACAGWQQSPCRERQGQRQREATLGSRHTGLDRLLQLLGPEPTRQQGQAPRVSLSEC